MTVNDVLDSLIANAAANQTQLDNLIYELGSGTPVADVGEQPTFDTVSEKWIFAQTTANDNGEFLGIYKLTSELFCALLQALDIIAFTPPQAPNVPARILPCGADPLSGWVNLPALVDLDGQEMNQFSIRSATAFEVKLRMQASCHTVIVDADVAPPGVDTGINVLTGEQYAFVATGLWGEGVGQVDRTANGLNYNPGGFVYNGNLLLLIGRIGTSGDWFPIGADNTVTMPSSGRLYLAANDLPNSYEGNEGQQTVGICFVPA